MAVLLAGGAARAEPAEVELLSHPALTRLVQVSLEARPELAAAAARVDAQRQLAPQARALPDPMVELGIQNDGFARLEIGSMENSFVSLMSSQTIPWPGRLLARGKVAELGAEQAEQGVERARLGIRADVQRAYLELLLARDRLALLARLEELWRKSADLARSRYEVGEGAQSDVLRAQLELNRVKQRRWLMEADEQLRLRALNRLRGAPLSEALPTDLQVGALALPRRSEPAAAAQEALERSPERRAAQLAVAAAEQAVSAARQSYVPDFTFRAGLMPRGSLPPMWTLAVGSTLPIYVAGKQNRALDESEARLRAARRDLEAVEAVIAVRAAQRQAVLGGLEESVRLYREGLLIQSRATAESTLAQYKVGKVGFFAVLESNAGYIADEDGYLGAVADAWRLEIAEREVSLAEVPAAGGGTMATEGLGGGGMAAPASAGAAPVSPMPAAQGM